MTGACRLSDCGVYQLCSACCLGRCSTVWASCVGTPQSLGALFAELYRHHPCIKTCLVCNASRCFACPSAEGVYNAFWFEVIACIPAASKVPLSCSGSCPEDLHPCPARFPIWHKHPCSDCRWKLTGECSFHGALQHYQMPTEDLLSSSLSCDVLQQGHL